MTTVKNVVRACAALVLGAAIGGCPGAPDPGPPDGSTFDAPPIDGIALDASTLCATDADCSDGVFCNGAETCAPGASDADARGCAPATTPCLPGQTCDESADRCVSECGAAPDADGDGVDSIDCGGTDCDDADAARHPGALEICDVADRDEDCNPSTFGFRDADGDAYPDATCCNLDTGGARVCGDDCNDSRPNVHPGLGESCDLLDNDCDTLTDEGVGRTFYPDLDGDGYGDAFAPSTSLMMGCTLPPGFAESGTDCLDDAAAVHPGALEQCDLAMLDENCDGDANPAALCTCSGDVTRGCMMLGGVCAAGTERCIGGSWGLCSITPTAEVCNGFDDDCDGSTDETLSVTCYPDGDNDGYADAGAVAGLTCPVPGRDAFAGCPPNQTNRAPVGATGIDCNDADSTVSPGSPELCDAAMVDEDCDGRSNPPSLCACIDGETRTCASMGSCGAGSQTCVSGRFTACTINPVAESCNGADDDCDGTTDEGLTVTCYADADNDGHAPASAASPIEACPVMGRTYVGGCPTGMTNLAPGAFPDCDDTRSLVSPAAVEVCDAAMVDENCDGVANPATSCACSGSGTEPCPLGGACAAGTRTCSGGAWSECSIRPTAETCDSIDNDCDGTPDEGLTVSCYTDADNDGWAPATATSPTSVCPVSGRAAVGGCPTGMTNVPPGTSPDCDDTRSFVSPAATELCDTAMLDENCDGMANPAATCECAGSGTQPCPLAGVCAAGTRTCSGGRWTECTIRPTTEICDGLDNDCDGTADEMLTVACYADADNDGYAPTGTAVTNRCADASRPAVGGCPSSYTNRSPAMGADCNATNPAISPAAVEVCDAGMVDENCDGMANPAALCACSGSATQPCPLGGVCAAGTRTCASGAWSECTIRPTAETCDGLDNDCDGAADEMLTVSCYTDADNDGWAPASAATPSAVCPVTGRAAVGGCPTGTTNVPPGSAPDCDDTRSLVSPAAVEVCDMAMLDENCDGMANPAATCACSGSVTQPCPLGGVCAAGTRTCSSGAWGECTIRPTSEICDGLDNDCDGTTDEMLTVTCYADTDNDGYAPTGTASSSRCSDPSRAAVGGCPAGYTNRSPAMGADCNATNAAISPAAIEVCNGVDDNCAGGVDEGVRTTFYRDADGDGFGGTSPTMLACTAPVGYVATSTDCNDGAAAVNPAAVERCDGIDNNCDGMTDPGCACTDGATRACVASGVCAAGIQSCASGAWGACSISPSVEVCNGLDDDCDGTVDDATGGGSLRVSCWDDDDDDGYAVTGTPMLSLCPVTGRAAVGGCPFGTTNRNPSGGMADCNDASDLVYPGAPELCNGASEDCDAAIDEGLTTYVRYRDTDGDGREGSTIMACDGAPGTSAFRNDCDETSVRRLSVYVGAPELCDGWDNNCDGSGGIGPGLQDPNEDRDGDGYMPTGFALCSGGTLLPGDCNDVPGAGGASDYPGAAEVCDTRDNDCDGLPDEDPAADASCASVAGSYVGCSAGACVVVGCEAMRGDCDAYGFNGCEIDTASSSAHCSACGLGCGGGGACLSGVCDPPADLALGLNYTCWRYASGRAACFGNYVGEPGANSTTPQPVPGLTGATSLAAWYRHTCALMPGGTVSCWGENAYGQLGRGSTSFYSGTAMAVSGLTGVAEVDVGQDFSCARLTTGAVRCWGRNGNGQLGDGTTTDRLAPTPVLLPAGWTALDLEVGMSHACVAAQNGASRAIYCWGANLGGQVGNGTITPSVPTPAAVTGLTTSVTRLAGGGNHTCAAVAGGTTYCWGDNLFGQLGNGTTTSSSSPVVVTGITSPSQLVAGWDFSCATVATGTRCWGRNSSGQLGDPGAGAFSSTSVAVQGLGALATTALWAGADFACARDSASVFRCWGENFSGQLGNGSTTDATSATPMTDLRSAGPAAASDWHSCARRSTGDVLCWGFNNRGQLGNGSTGGPGVPFPPQLVTGLSGVVELETGYDSTCARLSNGRVYCWGANTHGQLGDGSMADRNAPVLVSGITNAIDIDVGFRHACAVLATGAVRCWGSNLQGGLGDGTTTDRPTPVAATGISDATSISVGDLSTCATSRSGTLYCWGGNAYGQLGMGDFTSRYVPTAVPGLVDVVEVATDSHTCALRSTGALLCWGHNGEGQVGDGTRTDRSSPVAVLGLPADVVAASVSFYNTCAVRESGAAYCWGDGSFGQVGDGAFVDRLTPRQVTSHADFVTISVGSGHVCASRGFSGVACWGRNLAEQLGAGPGPSSASPVMVIGLP